jgi:hypothetical protein
VRPTATYRVAKARASSNSISSGARKCCDVCPRPEEIAQANACGSSLPCVIPLHHVGVLGSRYGDANTRLLWRGDRERYTRNLHASAHLQPILWIAAHKAKRDGVSGMDVKSHRALTSWHSSRLQTGNQNPKYSSEAQNACCAYLLLTRS